MKRTISVVCQAIAFFVVLAMVVPCLGQAESQKGDLRISSETGTGAASERYVPEQTADYVPGELVVRLNPGAAMSSKGGSVVSGIQSLDSLNQELNLKGVQKLRSGSYVIRFDPTVDVRSAADLYEKDRNVIFAEPNVLRHLYSEPNDTWYSQQWAHELAEAPAAWDITTGSSDVVVALIDSGVDMDHPDLEANIWINDDETPGNGRDDDHNGFVDDVQGWDFINNDNDPDDDMFHGTHCAGIIAGIGNNGIGVAGVTWNCNIMVLKAGTDYGSLPISAVIDALYYAVDNGADIVSMSFGGTAYTDEEYDAIEYAHSKGLLLIAAAGNNANDVPTYPASFPEVVAVSATDAAGNPAFFTSYGDWVDVSAPGLSLLSTFLNGTYAPCSGTSMACPYAAGVAALIWSEFPHLSRDGVRSQLQNTTDDLGTPGFDNYFGWGMVNARWAVDHTSPSCDLRLWGLKTTHILKPNATDSIAVTVLNFGRGTVTSVSVSLYINESLTDSKTIAQIEEKHWQTVTFNWTTATEGTYNLRAYVTPKSGDPPSNNNATAKVIVRSAETISVPTDFKWLQQGLSWADDGYTVNVKEGSYYGQFVAPNAIDVAGEDVQTTIIDGMIGLQPLVYAKTDGLSFSNLSFERGSYGINAAAWKHITVTGCDFSNCTDFGIGTWSESIIVENTFEYCHVAAYVVGEGCRIAGNTVLVNTDEVPCYAGFRVLAGSNASVDNNTITDRSVLHSWQAYGILFESAQFGLTWVTTTDSTVADNIIEGIMSGMDIAGEDNEILRNEVTNCSYWGIGISYGSWAVTTLIKDNLINGCQQGIMSLQGTGNTIVGNIIKDCTGTGMYLSGDSSSTSVIDNSIEGCAKGIFEGRQAGTANTFHHNNMIDNDLQLETWGQPNAWDDGAGEGNYWSNYTGADTDEDGVGETALPCCGVDNNPLMHPWGSISDLDTGLKYATVQSAIDASETQNGDTILVKEGNYSEQVVLWNRTGLVLQGEEGTVFRDYASPTLNIHSSASGSTITGFTVVNCSLGIYVWNGANGNNVNNNTIQDCTNGIELLSDSSNLVCDNTISECGNGVLILQMTGAGNQILRNAIVNNTRGIYMIAGHNDVFRENLIMGNGYGLYLTGSANEIYHNNIVSNNVSAFVSGTTNNTWDDGYPSGGNYWSDYTGMDQNQDGIGDTPYVINANNQDRYPLMNPWM